MSAIERKTLKNFLFIFFISTAFIINLEACITNLDFKLPNILPNIFPSFVAKETSTQNIWDGMDLKRTTNKSCECGIFNPKNWTSPWNLFVHVNSTVANQTCTGTIVASNLLVTSHKCLIFSGRKMRLYDMLKIRMSDKDRAMPVLEEVTVTNTKVWRDNTAVFKVVEIFYNPQYAQNSEMDKFTESDLVIIKVAENLFSHSGSFSPICVPFYDKMRMDNLPSFYYNLATERINSQESDIPFRYFGTIWKPPLCYQHLYDSDMPEETEMMYNNTLCFEFGAIETHTKVVGGPVIYSHKDSSGNGENSIAFIMGVATVISSKFASGFKVSAGFENVYFSPIQPLVKFIEYYASRKSEDSVWCKTPKFKPQNIIPNTMDVYRLHATKWPWENLREPVERDESLDCVCGVPKSGLGRIAGGSEAPSHEYGWMAALIVFNPNGGGHLCGGAIINDRVILTAAHCIVGEKEIKDRQQKMWTDPEQIEVTINVHRRERDPEEIKLDVAAVLFHPGYVIARASHQPYYDYDMALLVLTKPLTFLKNGTNVLPICLSAPGDYMQVVGKNATVAGWGKMDPERDDSMAEALQQITVPVQPLSDCQREPLTTVTDNFLCAGTFNRYKDSAQGDSGGPMMVRDPDTNQWYEVGLVSFGYDMNDSNETIALYTDVQKLLPFVDYHSKRAGAKWCAQKRS